MEMICKEFLEEDNRYHHSHDERFGGRTWEVMFYNYEGESCGVSVSDDEFCELLTEDQVANTFVVIGDSARVWEHEQTRQFILDKALQCIEEHRQAHFNEVEA
jgi:hypothetical protein|tara:strand:- start:51 stop:359 length:309 start_codon:yes stop_codon:yes gene_type:complete